MDCYGQRRDNYQNEGCIMDFNKLFEPYEEGVRTIEAQVKWLLAKNIPRHHVDQAMLTVYDEIEKGKVFEGDEKFSAGYYLDRELLRVAQELHTSEVSDSIRKLEDFWNNLAAKSVAEATAKMNKPLNRLQRFGKWLFRL